MQSVVNITIGVVGGEEEGEEQHDDDDDGGDDEDDDDDGGDDDDKKVSGVQELPSSLLCLALWVLAPDPWTLKGTTTSGY